MAFLPAKGVWGMFKLNRRVLGLLGILATPGLTACSVNIGTGEQDDVGSVAQAVCSSASVSTSPTPGGPVGTPVTVTASATCDGGDTKTYKFYLYTPGSGWSMVQDWSTSNTYNWTTTGLTGGTYYFQAWARAQGSTATYEAYAGTSYQLGGSACTGGGISASPPTGTTAGSPVVVSGSATCGGTANYKFYMQAPGGAWNMVQDWSTDSTYDWDTTGATSGAYNFQVWVRNSSSTATYETYAGMGYQIYSGCTNGTIYASPSVATTGDNVNVVGGATCGGTAEYKIWMLQPGGTWTVVSDWSPTNYWVWNTTGAPTGTTYFQSWERRVGSSSDPFVYETWAGMGVNHYAPCSGALGTFSPPGSTTIGTPVTVTGSATCGGTAEYKFYVLAPGAGSWALAQDWGTDSTYDWNTTGASAGTYGFQVWVRTQGTSHSYESYDYKQYTLN